ncbi:hypothetical protein [Amycolatopsis sp.]|nr:hypothetical protein [Amycolatopsis sp.]
MQPAPVQAYLKAKLASDVEGRLTRSLRTRSSTTTATSSPH